MDGRRKTEAKIAGRVGEMEEQISSVAENAQEQHGLTGTASNACLARRPNP